MLKWDGRSLELDGQRTYYPCNCTTRRRELLDFMLLEENCDGVSVVSITVFLYGKYTERTRNNAAKLIEKVRKDLTAMYPKKTWLKYDTQKKLFHLMG